MGLDCRRVLFRGLQRRRRGGLLGRLEARSTAPVAAPCFFSVGDRCNGQGLADVLLVHLALRPAVAKPVWTVTRAIGALPTPAGLSFATVHQLPAQQPPLSVVEHVRTRQTRTFPSQLSIALRGSTLRPRSVTPHHYPVHLLSLHKSQRNPLARSHSGALLQPDRPPSTHS